MAGKKQFPNGTWQYIFKRSGVLEKPIYMTFETEEEGDEYARKMDVLLDRGIVPTEHKRENRILTIAALVSDYERNANPSPKDVSALNVVVKTKGATALLSITAEWVDGWIEEMKRVDKIAPATIRARVGALARCTDWGMRKRYLVMLDHPMRSLPDGYAQYSQADVAAAGIKRVDVERDRRLEHGEYEKIIAVIDSGVLARKQRPLMIEYPKAYRLLFVLAVESCMRLREMYTLTLDQIDLPKRTVFLEKTKNGDKRQVPLTTVSSAALREYLVDRELPDGIPKDMLLPWWDGVAKSLPVVSDYLSKRFKDIFEQAGAVDLRFHDLRHEAVSRLFERTTLSELQIMKISGHKSHRMVMRYANLRGSDLAAALW